MGKMGMHVKSDSDVTSVEASSPPRSPSRRPLYYVQSPTHSQQHEQLEKLSYGVSSPYASPPTHHHQLHYHCSPIHHSRESSTSRFSANSLQKLHPNVNAAALGWKRIDRRHPGAEKDEDGGGDDDEVADSYDGNKAAQLRFYVGCFVFGFAVLFTVFSLILWAASATYQPEIFVKKVVFESMSVQAGIDGSGVATDMMNLKSSVKIFFRNPATFFGVHVTATPLQLHYYDLLLASGLMNEFYQSRKSERLVVVVVRGYQVPLYGGVPALSGSKAHLETAAALPLNLTFTVRSRAYVLGRLVKPKFYTSIFCQLSLRGHHLGKPVNLANSDRCAYG